MAATLELTAKENVSETLFKLEQQNLRLIEQNKRLAQESGRAHKQSADGIGQVNRYLQQQQQDLRGVALGIIGGGGVVGAVQVAIGVYNEWRDKMLELGKVHAKFVDDFVAGMVKTKDASQSRQIEAWMESLSGDVSLDQAQKLFAGVTKGNKDLPLKRRQELVAEMAKSDVLFTGRESEMGELAGQVEKLMPGQSATAVYGASRALQKFSGFDAQMAGRPKFRRMVQIAKSVGVPPEEAMAQMAVAVGEGMERPGALMAMYEAIGSEEEPTKAGRGRPLTPQQRTKNRFLAASQTDRLRLIQSDKDVQKALLGDQALLAGLITSEKVTAGTAQIRAEMQGDSAAREMERLATSPAGMRAIQADVGADQLRGLQRPNRERGEYIKAYQDMAAEDMKGLGAAQSWGAWMDFKAAELVFDRPDRKMASSLRYAAKTTSYEDQAEQLNQRAARWEEFGRREDLIEESKRQTAVLEQIERNSRGPGRGAVQKNVTQHGEPRR